MEDGRCLLDVIGDPDALDQFLDREANGQASAAAANAGQFSTPTAYMGALQAADSTMPVTASLSFGQNLQAAQTQAGVQQLTVGYGQTQAFSSQFQPQSQPTVVANYALPQLIASHTTPQLVANQATPRLVANNAAAQLVANNITSQLVANQTTPQFVANQMTPRPVANNTAAQLVANNAAAQLVANNISSQLAANNTTPQLVANQTTQQFVANQTTQQLVIANHTTPQLISNQTTPQLVANQTTPQLVSNQTTPQLVAKRTTPQVVVANSLAPGQNMLVTSLNGRVPVWPQSGIQPQYTAQLSTASPASSPGLAQISRASTQAVQKNSTQLRPVGGQPGIVLSSQAPQWQPQPTGLPVSVSAVNLPQLQGSFSQQPRPLIASQGGLQLGMQLIQTSLGNKLIIPSQPLVAGLNGQQLNVTTLQGLQMAPQQLGQAVINAAVQPKTVPVTRGVGAQPTHIILQPGQQPVLAPNQNIIIRAMPSNIVQQLQQGVVSSAPRQSNPSQPILITSQLQPQQLLQQQLLQPQQQQQQLLQQQQPHSIQPTTAAPQVATQNLKTGNVLVNIGGQNVSVTLDQLQNLQQQVQQQQQLQQLQQQQQMKKLGSFVNASPVQILPGAPQQQTIMLTMQQLQQLQQKVQQQQVIVNKQQTQPFLTVPTTSTSPVVTATAKLAQSNCVPTNGVQAMSAQPIVGSPQLPGSQARLQQPNVRAADHRVIPTVSSSQRHVVASSTPMQSHGAMTSPAGGLTNLQQTSARFAAPNVNIQTLGLSSRIPYAAKVSATNQATPPAALTASTAGATHSVPMAPPSVPVAPPVVTTQNQQLVERLQQQIHVLMSMQHRTEEQQRWLEQLVQMQQTKQASLHGEQSTGGSLPGQEAVVGPTPSDANSCVASTTVFVPPVVQVPLLVATSGTAAVTTTVRAALTNSQQLKPQQVQPQQPQQPQQQASWSSLPPSVRERLQAQLARMTPDQQLLFHKNETMLLQRLQQQMLKHQQVLKQQQLGGGGPVKCQMAASDNRQEPTTTLPTATSAAHKPILRKTFSRSQLISQQMSRDQQKVVSPNHKAPFKNYTDVVKRLIRYHVFQTRENTPEELRKGEELFAEVAEELLEKKRQMLNKYQLLLLNDSMRIVQPSEQVMLQRMFLTEERAQLQRDRQLARDDPKSFKPMPYISRVTSAVTTSPAKHKLPSNTSVSDTVSSSGSASHGGSKSCGNGKAQVKCDPDSKCNGSMSPCYTLQHADGLKVVFKSSPIHPSSQKYSPIHPSSHKHSPIHTSSHKHSPSRYSGGEELTLEGSSRRLDSSGSPFDGGTKRDRADETSGSEDDANKRLRLGEDEVPFQSYSKGDVVDSQSDGCLVDSEADTAVAGLLSSTDEYADDNLQADVSVKTETGAYNWDVKQEVEVLSYDNGACNIKQEVCSDGEVSSYSAGTCESTFQLTNTVVKPSMSPGALKFDPDLPFLDDSAGGDVLSIGAVDESDSGENLQDEMESAINSIISLGHPYIP